MPVRCHLVFCLCMRGAAACSSALKISTVSKNTNQSAKPLWLVFSLSNLWIIVSSFVTLPSSQNQPLSAVVKGCQYILLAHLLHIACSFTAIKYMAARLKKLPAANKLLIVSTDGRSADGADALQKIIKEAKKDGVTVIGAGIGESRSAVEKEFGNAFLDVSDMAKMPQLLAGVVKRHLLR